MMKITLQRIGKRYGDSGKKMFTASRKFFLLTKELITVPTNSKVFLRGLVNKQILASVIEI